MEEFALCWKNFQDNIADGFHGLFLRGDLVDVTLACGDGRLLQAHKTVLAICSPYFQEMFLTNPCKHPIIVLKDVAYDVMTALLQFMYQGVVNVKHDELPVFMKIAASLQIKGLTAHEEQHHNNNHNNNNTNHSNNNNSNSLGTHQKYSGHNNNAHKDSSQSATATTGSGGGNAKRSQEVQHESYSIMAKQRRTHQPPQQRLMAEFLHQVQLNQHHQLQQQSRSTECELSSHSEEGGNSNQQNSNMTEDALMPAISLTESPYQLGHHHPHVKRESMDQSPSPQVNNGSSNSTTAQNHNNNGSLDKPLFNPPMKLEFGSSELQAAAAAAAAAVCYPLGGSRSGLSTSSSPLIHSNDLNMSSQDMFSRSANHMEIPTVTPGEKWHHGKLEFMLSQRGKPLLVHDSHTFGIQYIRKDKKYWQCNLSRKYNCKARVTTTEAGDIIVTNNEHCHTEIRQHLRKDYKLNRLHMSQSLLQQHALQINLNRLSAAHRQTQMPTLGSQVSMATTQEQQQFEAIEMAKTLAKASLKYENNGNNGQDSNSAEKNGGEQAQEEDEGQGKDLRGPEEELSKRMIPDWKEELFRNVTMREDIK